METEGTYPFAGGGVSTWCHILTQELGQVDFYIFAVTGEPKWTLKYNLSPNVKKVKQIPLWGTVEPWEFINDDDSFADVYERKKRVTSQVVRYRFLPLFEKFLNGLHHPNDDVYAQARNLLRLYRYFQEYDYKDSLRSEPVWQLFKKTVLEFYTSQYPEHELPSLNDMTTTMRWIYHYFLPLAADIPQMDIAHTTIAGFSGLAGCILKLEYGTPFLVTDHGVFIRERYIAISASDFSFFIKRFLLNMSIFVTRLVYYLADQVSPVADFNKRWELRFGVTPDKFKTIHNGIDPSVFVPQEKPAKTRGRPTVVSTAHIIPLKDIETMIRASDIVRKKIKDVQFRVYGSKEVDPNYAKKCQRLIDKSNLGDVFLLAGYHSNPAEVYNEGDLTVLSSISEGFPYTVIESMASARPVVATDVGGVREALEDYGILVKPRDPQALADGIITLLEDAELRQQMGQQAREQALLKYRISSSVEEYLKSYYRLLAKSSEDGDKHEFSHTSGSVSDEQLIEMWREVL